MRNAVRWSREGLRRTREGLRRNGCGPPLAILGALSILTRVSILQNSSGQRDLITFGHESELWFLSKIKQAPLKIRLQIEAKYHAASNRQPCRVIDRCPVSAGCNWQETRLERTAGNVPARFRKSIVMFAAWPDSPRMERQTSELAHKNVVVGAGVRGVSGRAAAQHWTSACHAISRAIV